MCVCMWGGVYFSRQCRKAFNTIRITFLQFFLGIRVKQLPELIRKLPWNGKYVLFYPDITKGRKRR